MARLAPFPLAIKRGADLTLKPRFTAAIPANIGTWTAKLVVKLETGPEIYSKISPIITELGTPHIGSSTFEFSEEDTSKLWNGTKQNYHVMLSDGLGWSDIVLHGPIDGYVRSGA